METTIPTTRGAFEYPAGLKRGWTLLFYYAGDFLPVSATELQELAKLAGEFRRRGCGILAVSADSIPAHLAFLETLARYRGAAPVTFPLGSDAGGALRAALCPEPGMKYLWLLAPGGGATAVFAYPAEVGANFTEALRTLAAARTGKHTPAGWVPGAQALLPPPQTAYEARHFMRASEKSGHICTDWYLCFE